MVFLYGNYGRNRIECFIDANRAGSMEDGGPLRVAVSLLEGASLMEE